MWLRRARSRFESTRLNASTIDHHIGPEPAFLLAIDATKLDRPGLIRRLPSSRHSPNRLDGYAAGTPWMARGGIDARAASEPAP